MPPCRDAPSPNPLQRLYHETRARWDGHPWSFRRGEREGPKGAPTHPRAGWHTCITKSPLFQDANPSVVALARSVPPSCSSPPPCFPWARQDLCVTPALVRTHWGVREWDLRLLSHEWTYNRRAMLQCAAIWRIEGWWKRLTAGRDALLAWAVVDKRENP